MMPKMQKPIDERANDVYQSKFDHLVGDMSRKQRRTIQGKLLVAEAENAALRAKLAFLERGEL